MFLHPFQLSTMQYTNMPKAFVTHMVPIRVKQLSQLQLSVRLQRFALTFQFRSGALHSGYARSAQPPATEVVTGPTRGVALGRKSPTETSEKDTKHRIREPKKTKTPTSYLDDFGEVGVNNIDQRRSHTGDSVLGALDRCRSQASVVECTWDNWYEGHGCLHVIIAVE